MSKWRTSQLRPKAPAPIPSETVQTITLGAVVEPDAYDLNRLTGLFPKPEALDPELTGYIEHPLGVGCPVLKHPFITELYFPALNARYNEQYLRTRERALAYLNRRNYLGYLTLVSRPFRLHEFVTTVAHRVTGPRYWSLLRYIYTDSESIGPNIDAVRALWNRDTPGREKMMTADERRVYDSLPDLVEVYRGCRARYAKKQSVSWTLDLDTAVRFACRWRDGDAVVLRATVPRSAVLAYLDSRGEQEVVLTGRPRPAYRASAIPGPPVRRSIRPDRRGTHIARSARTTGPKGRGARFIPPAA